MKIPIQSNFRWFVLSFCSLGSLLASADTDPICDLPDFKAAKITSVSLPAGYWFNALDDRYNLMMAGGKRGIDLTTGNEIKSMTGSFDPYPAPTMNGIDRKLYVHPDPFRFHYFPDTLKGQSDPVYKDPELEGWYESIATLDSQKSDGKNFSIYRGITANGKGLMRDYRIEFSEDGHPKSVTPIQDHPIKLCGNWRDPSRRKPSDPDPGFSTPIISPKGDEMAISDSRPPNHTLVVKIDSATGDCEKVDDLGFTTGKVHFSPDGKKIGFSAYSLSLPGGVSCPGRGDSKCLNLQDRFRVSMA